VIRYQHYTLT